MWSPQQHVTHLSAFPAPAGSLHGFVYFHGGVTLLARCPVNIAEMSETPCVNTSEFQQRHIRAPPRFHTPPGSYSSPPFPVIAVTCFGRVFTNTPLDHVSRSHFDMRRGEHAGLHTYLQASCGVYAVLKGMLVH